MRGLNFGISRSATGFGSATLVAAGLLLLCLIVAEPSSAGRLQSATFTTETADFNNAITFGASFSHNETIVVGYKPGSGTSTVRFALRNETGLWSNYSAISTPRNWGGPIFYARSESTWGLGVYDDTTGAAYFTRTTNYGANWTTPVEVTGLNTLGVRNLYSPSAGVWLMALGNGTSTRIHRSSDDGATWSTVLTAGSGLTAGYFLQSGAKVQFLQIRLVGLNGTNGAVVYQNSNDYGATWGSTLTTVYDDVGGNSGLAASGPSGDFWVAQWSDLTGTDSVKVALSDDAGVTWSLQDSFGAPEEYNTCAVFGNIKATANQEVFGCVRNTTTSVEQVWHSDNGPYDAESRWGFPGNRITMTKSGRFAVAYSSGGKTYVDVSDEVGGSGELQFSIDVGDGPLDDAANLYGIAASPIAINETRDGFVYVRDAESKIFRLNRTLGNGGEGVGSRDVCTTVGFNRPTDEGLVLVGRGFDIGIDETLTTYCEDDNPEENGHEQVIVEGNQVLDVIGVTPCLGTDGFLEYFGIQCSRLAIRTESEFVNAQNGNFGENRIEITTCLAAACSFGEGVSCFDKFGDDNAWTVVTIDDFTGTYWAITDSFGLHGYRQELPDDIDCQPTFTNTEIEGASIAACDDNLFIGRTADPALVRYRYNAGTNQLTPTESRADMLLSPEGIHCDWEGNYVTACDGSYAYLLDSDTLETVFSHSIPGSDDDFSCDTALSVCANYFYVITPGRADVYGVWDLTVSNAGPATAPGVNLCSEEAVNGTIGGIGSPGEPGDGGSGSGQAGGSSGGYVAGQVSETFMGVPLGEVAYGITGEADPQVGGWIVSILLILALTVVVGGFAFFFAGENAGAIGTAAGFLGGSALSVQMSLIPAWWLFFIFIAAAGALVLFFRR